MSSENSTAADMRPIRSASIPPKMTITMLGRWYDEYKSPMASLSTANVLRICGAAAPTLSYATWEPKHMPEARSRRRTRPAEAESQHARDGGGCCGVVEAVVVEEGGKEGEGGAEKLEGSGRMRGRRCSSCSLQAALSSSSL